MNAPPAGLQRIEPELLAGVALWLLDLEAPMPANAAGLLDSDECLRMARFHFEHDRRRYLHSHAALRWLLGRELGLPGRDIAFATGPHGKPALAAPLPPLSFNLSHAERFALIAIGTSTPLGVDIESATRQDRHALDEIARGCFSAAEIRALSAVVDDGEHRRAFLRGWTRKEACLKALGVGLGLEPSSFHAGLAPDRHDAMLVHEGRAQPVRVVTVPLPPHASVPCEAALAWQI